MLPDRHLEVVRLVVVVRPVLPHVVRDAGRAQIRTGEAVVDGVVRADRSDALRPADVDLVAGEEAMDLFERVGERVQEVQEAIEPSVGQVRHHAADPGRGCRDPCPRERLVQRVDPLALLECVEEGRERTDVDRGGSEPEQVAEDPVELHADHADDLAALRDLDAHQLLDRHHVRAVVDERREVVHPVG